MVTYSAHNSVTPVAEYKRGRPCKLKGNEISIDGGAVEHVTARALAIKRLDRQIFFPLPCSSLAWTHGLSWRWALPSVPIPSPSGSLAEGIRLCLYGMN